MRKIIRIVIDLVASLCTWGAVLTVSGSVAYAALATSLICAYGVWCFIDGLLSARA